MVNQYFDFILYKRSRYILSWLSPVPLVGLVWISPSYSNTLVEQIPSGSLQQELSPMGDRCFPAESSCSIPLAQNSLPKYNVERIIVTGSTIFGEEEFFPITQKYSGREVTQEELEFAVDAITQLYLAREFITTEAIFDSVSTTGVVEIKIIEGGIEEIRIEGVRNLDPNYIRKRVRLGARTPPQPQKARRTIALVAHQPPGGKYIALRS